MIIVKTLMSTFFTAMSTFFTTMSLPLTQIIFHQTILVGIFKDFTENSFSVLHVKSYNFGFFAELYKLLSFKFSIICFSETWSNDENLDKNSLFQLEGYSLLHENRKYRRGGGVAIFVHESLCYTKRNDLCINCEAIESLSIEIRNNDGKNIIFNIVYRPPDGDLEVCENYFQSILSHNSIRNKSVILARDFNINVLYFEQNKKTQNFVNLMFQFGHSHKLFLVTMVWFSTNNK